MLAFATLKLIKQVVSNGVSPESTRLVSAALLKNDSACSAVVFDTSYTACDSAVLPLQERSNTAFCSVYADISSPYCSIMPSEALSLTGFTVWLMILLSFSGVWLMTTQYNTIWFMYFLINSPIEGHLWCDAKVSPSLCLIFKLILWELNLI